ncbi:hypothetical protein [Microbacterium sp. NPDC057650]|uniref:hypothetical protein n=1 Tax=unclassified Microbacterium TaxID=2609290 RepID=UPI00366F4F42
MPRTIGILLAAGLLAIGLAACAPTQDATTAPTATRTDAADAPAVEPTLDDGTPVATLTPVEAADALCRAGDADDDRACVITGQQSTADLSFEGYDVVKLIDSSFDGNVAVGGVRELVVTDSTFGGDLTVTRTQGVVVKVSQIDGTLAISQAQHATLVKNTVAGDLTCDSVRADGNGNQVTGTNTCSVR